MPEMDQEQKKALGNTGELQLRLARALHGRGFTPMPKPGAHDWLSVHPEPGQTFTEYAASHPPRPRAPRRMLALLPIGEPTSLVSTELLRRYAEAFFQLRSRLLPAAALDETHARRRTNPWTHQQQLRAPDLLDFLRSRVPDDAFALVGFTHEDLYPEESWNFVFGQASVRDRVGVFSFARYDPSFLGEPRGPDDDLAMRRRCMNVLVHETGHMFGLAHCVYFACVMNGSNHLAETDRRPPHACPICLRKLHHVIRFDVHARYAALERVYGEAGFEAERRWTRDRMSEIEDFGAPASR
jgi:archaemetzincin